MNTAQEETLQTLPFIQEEKWNQRGWGQMPVTYQFAKTESGTCALFNHT